MTVWRVLVGFGLSSSLETLDYLFWAFFFFSISSFWGLSTQASLSTCSCLTWKKKSVGLVYTCVFVPTDDSAYHYPSLGWWILTAVHMLRPLCNLLDVNTKQWIGRSAALRMCSTSQSLTCMYKFRAHLKANLSVIMPSSCMQSTF